MVNCSIVVWPQLSRSLRKVGQCWLQDATLDSVIKWPSNCWNRTLPFSPAVWMTRAMALANWRLSGKMPTVDFMWLRWTLRARRTSMKCTDTSKPIYPNWDYGEFLITRKTFALFSIVINKNNLMVSCVSVDWATLDSSNGWPWKNTRRYVHLLYVNQ